MSIASTYHSGKISDTVYRWDLASPDDMKLQEENGSLSICLHHDYQPTLARRERGPVDMPTPGLSANTGKKRTEACRYAYTRTISQHWQEENGSLSICLHHDYQPTLARRERETVGMPTPGLSANTGKKRTGACRYAYTMTISLHWQEEKGGLSICLHQDYQPTLARRRERGPVDMPTPGLSANTGKKRTGACRYAYTRTISHYWQEENGGLSVCLHQDYQPTLVRRERGLSICLTQDYQPTLARRERGPVDMPTP